MTEKRYTAKCIAEALGLDEKLIAQRGQRLGFRTNRRGYTKEQVARIASINTYLHNTVDDVAELKAYLGII